MRVRTFWLLLATAVPGLLFVPLIGWPALVVPVAAVLVSCYVAVELCERVPALRPVRPVLALVLGSLALTEASLFHTTRGGVPTSESLRALLAGVTDSWQLVLRSSWPVRPEPELFLFVPILVLLVAMVGIELLRWPAVAIVPSLGLLGCSQLFVAVSGTVAALTALAYAVVAAGLFITRVRPISAQGVTLTVLLGVVVGLVATVVPTGPAYSVRQDQFVQGPVERTVNPLSEVAAQLAGAGDGEVFRYTSDAPVGLWRMLVLDEFSGVTWSASDRYRVLGAEVGPPAGLRVPTVARSARLSVPGGGIWLPSQAMPASVNGVAPLIDESTGTLALPDRAGPVTYDLSWWEPAGDLSGLADAAVSSSVPPGDVGAMPDIDADADGDVKDIVELASRATDGGRATFRTAIVLERYLSENYRLATEPPLPTGSGWPQLEEFLWGNKVGTSEQFAAAYVILARLVGIPARLVVGYRAPDAPGGGGETVVRGDDVHVWPEVAADGFGWVPLDPTRDASQAPDSASPLITVTERVREDVRDAGPDGLPPQPVGEPAPESGQGAGWWNWRLALWGGVGLLALVALAVLVVPVAKLVRTGRRRRRTGALGVVGAWFEARDLLRAHGTPVTPGMTARDLATKCEGSVVDSLFRLAVLLDTALWSGITVDRGAVVAAWSAVEDIRAALADRPLSARIRAVFTIR